MEYNYGDECQVKQPVNNSFRKGKVLIPAGATVKIVSVSQNMAIIHYNKESYSTRIDNLELKKQNHT